MLDDIMVITKQIAFKVLTNNCILIIIKQLKVFAIER